MRVTRVGEVGTTLAVTSNRCTLQRNSSPILVNLMMDTLSSSASYTPSLELWYPALGCCSESNIPVIQRYQHKVLKCIVNAPWYVWNSDLHCDLGIETVTDIIAKFAKSHEKWLQDHINIEVSRLLNVNNITRQLKQKKPFELVRR
jgi:hypothetical protein